MRRLVALLTVLTLAGPVLAQDRAMLEAVTVGLQSADQPEVLKAASAACILDLGDAEAISARFVAQGWVRLDEPDMGVTSLTPAAGSGVYVSLYDEGRICDVSSEVWGTETALASVKLLSVVDGLGLWDLKHQGHCTEFALSPKVNVEITSSGQDPVCQSETTSTLRFEAVGG